MNEIISGFFLNQSIGYQSVGKIKSLTFPIEYNYEIKSRKVLLHISTDGSIHLPAERDVLKPIAFIFGTVWGTGVLNK